MKLFDPGRPANDLGPLLLDSHGRPAANIPPFHTEPLPNGKFSVRVYLPTEFGSYRSLEKTGIESLDQLYKELVEDPEAFFRDQFRYDPARKSARQPPKKPATLGWDED